MKKVVDVFDALSEGEPDWSREIPRRFWDPSRRLIRSIRRYQKWKKRGGLIGAIMRRRYVLSHMFWSVVTSSEIPINCNIGGGFVLTHPTGVVISDKARIGVNCVVFQGVTIVRDVKIGDHSNICSGAQLIKPGVVVGNNCIVGANSVVLTSVADTWTVAGAPAKLVNKSTRSSVG